MPRKQYSTEDLEKAVEENLNGVKMKVLTAKYPRIPRRTITDRAKRLKEGIPIQNTGPAPILSMEMEEDLKDWIIAMQSQGLPVSRDTILVKGNEIYQQMYGVTRSAGKIGRGWLDRFLRRHPILTLRTSQMIKRVRAEANEEGLRIFFIEMMKHVIERKLTPDRIFNMDETGFAQKSKSKKIIGQR